MLGNETLQKQDLLAKFFNVLILRITPAFVGTVLSKEPRSYHEIY